MTESCSARSAELSAVQWYHVPGAVVPRGSEWVAGYYEPRENRIVLADDVIDDGEVVRHEMLHALLKQAGHPRAQFLEACAPIVSCQGACITDAGPWRPPTSDYALLPSDSLEVTSVATLLSPESDGQRWVALEIFVHNPRGAMLVASTVKSETPDTFAADVRGPEGGVGVVDVARDSSTLFFLPNETKRRLFEFRVASDLTPNHIPTGTHLIRGGYARVWAPYDTVIVSP